MARLTWVSGPPGVTGMRDAGGAEVVKVGGIVNLNKAQRTHYEARGYTFADPEPEAKEAPKVAPAEKPKAE